MSVSHLLSCNDLVLLFVTFLLCTLICFTVSLLLLSFFCCFYSFVERLELMCTYVIIIAQMVHRRTLLCKICNNKCCKSKQVSYECVVFISPLKNRRRKFLQNSLPSQVYSTGFLLKFPKVFIQQTSQLKSFYNRICRCFICQIVNRSFWNEMCRLCQFLCDFAVFPSSKTCI